MANSYVDGKVRDALVAAKGSRATAQKLLMAWAAEDPQLLLGISQPFLKAIAAAAIERGVRPSAPSRSAPAQPGRSRGSVDSALSKEALADVLSRLGRDPGEDAAPTRGRAGSPAPVKSATMVVPAGKGGQGGVTHEKAMMTLAKAFVAKKMR
ncbi:hypothetical protein JJL56_12765 [Azospirillum sp. YIM DDC1]|uniref:DUF721 domain-containing protein n=1 Tax=Azospirillum aestuarii TaxID=2802052 RepID=A0ABS1HYD8_9PROT|nr:hypothetical protein [Azospirillum aestuarii]MBK3773831.1 hypothetical protein [Azospirillum brasilense]MBK4719745.1 hypothetical protein [Azospirillum aestuarii]TWA89227.1 hypothetical protein FBY14_106104 [Azospirillum brasilense]